MDFSPRNSFDENDLKTQFEIDVQCLSRLESFGVSPETGFLPSKPLQRLPACYEPWEQLFDVLSKRLHAQNIRNAVENLPEFDVLKLETFEELNRAMLLLSMIGHAYVWGEKPISGRVPRIISKPWVQVAQILDRPPILACESICNQNWAKFDETKPIELDNIYILHQFYGGVDEAWFYLVTIAIEARGAEALKAICGAQQCVEDDEEELLTEYLTIMQTTIQEMKAILSRMEERCSPFVFYNRIRQFLAGWTSDAFHTAGGGVVYEGEFCEKPQHWHGGSAAQSALLPSLDACLGVKHDSKHSSSYLKDMRKYMPKQFRGFIESVEKGPSVPDYVENSTSESLKEVFNGCVSALADFRSFHIVLVTRFIISQSSKKRKERGTGGTSIMPFLKSSRDETASASQ